VTEVAEFERRYLERASGALGGAALDAISLARDPEPRGRLAAGWWSRADLAGVMVLPNPWDDRSGIERFERACWDVTNDVLASLAPRLDEVHDERLGFEGWQLVLAPWLLHLVSGLADRRLFLLAARHCAPGVPVLAGPASGPPADMAEAVEAIRTTTGNARLLTAAAEAMGLPAKPGPDARPTAAGAVAGAGPGIATRAALLARGAAGRLLLGGERGRRVVVVGHADVSLRQALALRRAVRGLRISQAPGIPAQQPPLDPGLRASLFGGEPRDAAAVTAPGTEGLAELTNALLPQLLPRSVLEGFSDLDRAALEDYGAPSGVVVGNYAAKEAENLYLARCAAAGQRLWFAQHGGFYFQGRANAQERLELRPGSTFISWGSKGPGVAAAGSPRLARLAGTHRGGDLLMLVEALHPPDTYVIRFASTPLGNQQHEQSQLLAAFVENLSAARAAARLKRFPAFYGAAEAPRPSALEGLASDGPSGARSAAAWMRSSRMAVLAYPDTPFVEAMAIGVPTVGLWNPERWELRPEAADVFGALAAAGVVHHDPASAAAHVESVWTAPAAWWDSAEVAAARALFLDRFGRGSGWLEGWAAALG